MSIGAINLLKLHVWRIRLSRLRTRRFRGKGRSGKKLKRLLQQALDGDATAYLKFLEILSGYLRGTLRRRLRGFDDDVEDVLQEVLLAMHNGLHTYRNPVPLTAWIAAIVRHKVADFFRSHLQREALHDPLADAFEIFATFESETLDAKRDIDSLLDQLPENQRTSIKCVRLQGLSIAETATLTGLTEATVKVGIHRGIKALSRFVQGKIK